MEKESFIRKQEHDTASRADPKYSGWELAEYVLFEATAVTNRSNGSEPVGVASLDLAGGEAAPFPLTSLSTTPFTNHIDQRAPAHIFQSCCEISCVRLEFKSLAAP